MKNEEWGMGNEERQMRNSKCEAKSPFQLVPTISKCVISSEVKCLYLQFIQNYS